MLVCFIMTRLALHHNNKIVGYGISIIISNNQYLQRPMNEERLEVLKNLYPVKTMRERLKFNNYYYMFHYLYRWAFIRAFLNYSFGKFKP